MLVFLKTSRLVELFPGQLKQKMWLSSHGAYIQKNVGKLAIYLVNNLCLPACDQSTSQLCISAS